MAPGNPAQLADRVDRPHWAYWTSILFGMSLLALLALHDDTYAAWCTHVTTVFSRPLLRVLLIGAVAAHVGEAAYAYSLASRARLLNTRIGWTLQTLVLGFPSLRLLLRRARAATH